MDLRALIQLVTAHCERASARRAIYNGLVAQVADPTLLDLGIGVDPIYDLVLARARGLAPAFAPEETAAPAERARRAG